jgi:hypothetical protein
VLIIFGLRVFFRTLAQGVFHCRRCGGDREYRHRAGRRWFTLFFLPVVPLNAVGEHVQCTTCKTRYVTDVLSQPTTAQMQAALPAGMRAAVSAMLRSGDPSNQASRQRAIEAVIASGVPAYDEAMLSADLMQPFEAIRPALNQVGGQLAIQAREWYLTEVIRIAMADGPLSETERHAALAIGADLGMTQAQVVGVVTMTEQSAGRG